MTTFLLVRHALCDVVGAAIAGRSPGVHLNAEGRAQADALAARLETAGLAAVYSSPLERARETAAPIARRAALDVSVADGLNEVDFGEWTGRTLRELDEAPGWKAFNTFRSGTPIPGGTTMAEVQARIVGELERIRRGHPNGRVAVVSHGDVLRAAVAYFIGVPIDLFQRLEIAPASVSGLALEPWGARLLFLNHVGDMPLG